MSGIPVLPPDVLRRIDELRATRPYDGREVVLMESRGGWHWNGVRGICTRLAQDGRSMVLAVDEDPDGYWPHGMEILAELDSETRPYFRDLEN